MDTDASSVSMTNSSSFCLFGELLSSSKILFTILREVATSYTCVCIYIYIYVCIYIYT